MSQPTPEYISTQLNHILATLQRDIDATNAKHQHELAVLRQIIQAKDEQINALTLQLKKYRITHQNANKDGSAAFKRITLARKANNGSQLPSEISNVNMAQSVLVEQKAGHNQSIKYIKPLPLKNLSTAVSVKTPRVPKQAKDKQNMVVSVKKVSGEGKGRSASARRGQQGKERSKVKTQSKRVQGSSEKKCINIIIPRSNFSSYSIRECGGEQWRV